jgi:DNA-binding response OmpR family regulator
MKVLVCDDDSSVYKLIAVTLQPRGHEVVCADDVHKAVELFEQSRKIGADFDLIITDVYMPGPSGFSLAGYVRGAGYNGRLAVLSGGAPELGNLASVQAEYWPKPEAWKDLVARVELPKDDENAKG